MIEIHDDRFDSELLACKVGKIFLRAPLKSTEELLSAVHTCKRDLLFCFTIFSRRNIEALEAARFSLINVRNTYRRSVRGETALPKADLPPGFVVFRMSQSMPTFSLELLEPLIQTIGETSRYYKDPLIPREKARSLYETWMLNSLYHRYADEAFVIARDNRPIGLITLKNQNARTSIDLFGVLPEQQRHGLGTHLLQLAYAYKERCGGGVMDVTTEGENITAIGFYERNGFVIEDMGFAYHKHSGWREL